MKKALQNPLFYFFVIVGFYAFGQQNPINSNILTEYKISEKVLDAALSATLQEGSFKQNITVTKTANAGEKSISKYQLIYDPAYKEGIDVQINYHKDSLDNLSEKELLKLMQEMHSFSRLSKSKLVDEKSLNIEYNHKDSLIISFSYNAKKLEPELAYGKKLKGKIYIVHGFLRKVELVNTKKIKFLNKKIAPKNFKSTTYYQKIDNPGGYIVSKVNQEFLYTKKKKKYSVILSGKTIAYNDLEGKALQWDNKPQNQIKKNTAAYKNLSGSLGWVLPIFGKNARKLGYSLPRPIGISVFNHQQKQLMQFTDLKVGFNDGKLYSLDNIINLPKSTVDQFTGITMVKADVWLLPFLNLMALLGRGENTIDGSLYLTDETKQFLIDFGGLVGLSPSDIPDYIPVKSNLNSLSYGAGFTLAGGKGNFNASLSYQFVVNSIFEANTTKAAHVYSPSLGYMTPFGVNLMIGAQGQYYKTLTEGFIQLEDNIKLNYNVDFAPVQWNYILGFYAPVSNHFDLVVQSGWGDRKSMSIVLGYRF